MATFRIIDIFKITDKGQVLSGQIIDDGIVLPGDKAILTIDDKINVFKIVGVNIQKEDKHLGLLISFSDFDKLSNLELKGKEIKIINASDKHSLTQTTSWIFLATALATNIQPADMDGISQVADGINHAVPTQKELQTSMSWLTNMGLVIKHGKNYELTNKGKLEYEFASKQTDKLLLIWKNLENSFADNYDK